MKMFLKLGEANLPEKFYPELVNEAQPFVFLNDGNHFRAYPGPFNFKSYHCSGDLDLPFDVCFFETGVGKPLLHVPLPEEHFLVYSILIADSPKHRHCFVFGHYEHEVGHNGAFSVPLDDLMTDDNSGGNARHVVFVALNCIREILKKLNSYELIEGKQHHKRKMSGNGIKRRVGDVIYLLPKKGKKPVEKESIPVGFRHISFSHRFLRRGHWRRIAEKSLGKNRHGERTEVGRTWVKSAEIGEGKLVKSKVRVLK